MANEGEGTARQETMIGRHERSTCNVRLMLADVGAEGEVEMDRKQKVVRISQEAEVIL